MGKIAALGAPERVPSGPGEPFTLIPGSSPPGGDPAVGPAVGPGLLCPFCIRGPVRVANTILNGM